MLTLSIDSHPRYLERLHATLDLMIERGDLSQTRGNLLYGGIVSGLERDLDYVHAYMMGVYAWDS